MLTTSIVCYLQRFNVKRINQTKYY